jgi:hypothetical protein
MNDTRGLPTIEEAIEELKRKPLVDLWPWMGVIYGVSRGTAYSMAARGEFDVVNAGRLIKIVTASERRKLGIEGA